MAKGLPGWQRLVKRFVAPLSPADQAQPRENAPMRQPHHRQRIFLRQWRKHRGYSLEQMADRMRMNKGALSRIERGERPYSQDFLEAASEILMTDPASLLMRDPSDPEGIWTLWDRVAEVDKPHVSQIVETFARQRKTGTDRE